MPSQDETVIDRARTREGTLRLWAAGALSLLLHGAGALWWLDRPAAARSAAEVRSMDVRITAESAPRPVDASMNEADPAVVQADVQGDPAAADQPSPKDEAVSALAQRSPRADLPRTPLDFRLPPEFRSRAPAETAPSEFFDSRLSADLERARRAREAARLAKRPLTRAPQLSAGAGEGRTRIASDLGCFERVRDPFEDSAGDQWWLMDCKRPGEPIDWAARFRGDP